ncbi:MAG: HXXEE domain-containing protein [Coriobacteriales bacterium]
MLSWLVSWGWIYCMTAMSIVLAVQLALRWGSWDALRKLGAFTVIVLTLHVWEEWVVPGGFHYIYNLSSEPALRNCYPMNELTDMITNFGGAVLWFALVQSDRFGRKMGFAVMVFSYFELAAHLHLAHVSLDAFWAQGVYTGFYAPGLATAVLCWLPLGIAFSVWFARNKIHWQDVVGGIALLVVFSLLLVTLPEALLKGADTPFPFANAGWYERWIG